MMKRLRAAWRGFTGRTAAEAAQADFSALYEKLDAAAFKLLGEIRSYEDRISRLESRADLRDLKEIEESRAPSRLLKEMGWAASELEKTRKGR